MPSDVRIRLPTYVADELVADGLAVRTSLTRGSSLPDTISLAVEAINTGSALVSIVVAASTCRRIAKSLLARLRSEDARIELTLTTERGTHALHVGRNDPDAEDRIIEFLLEKLDE